MKNSLKVKTFSVGSDQELQDILRKLDEHDYDIMHIMYIGFNSNVEKIYQVIYRKIAR